jgi:hypothetical protein
MEPDDELVYENTDNRCPATAKDVKWRRPEIEWIKLNTNDFTNSC